MNIILEITSSNLNSMKNFHEILINKLNKSKDIRFSIVSELSKKRKKKKFTILKSPHVNKTAREQFETVDYTKTIKIYSYQYLLLLFMIKRIKISSFSDVELKINFQYNLSKFHKHLKSNLNSNNKFLNRLELNTENINLPDKILSSTKNYLKCLDIFGESILKI